MIEKGPGFESPLVQRIFLKLVTGHMNDYIYQMGAGVIRVIPIAIVLDINVLGGVQVPTCEYLSHRLQLSRNLRDSPGF